MPESTPTILLVDDEDAVRKVLAFPLEKDGYTVVQAADGEEALRLFDKTQVDPHDPNSRHNAATFFQANGVVETDYTLQNFSGRLSNGAATDYPAGRAGNDFKNLHIFAQTPPAIHAFNMGGCQGCHANAQLGGTDFSFILDGNGFQSSPDAPGPATATAAAARYKQRFLRLN